MTRIKLILCLIGLTFFVNPLMAEGQEGLVMILDGMLFFFIFGLSIGITALALKAMPQKRSRKRSFFIWTIVLSASLFLWAMLKTDPYPFEGPIDSLFYHGALEDNTHEIPNKNIGYRKIADSTLETVTNAKDTSLNGVYIWLHQQKIFVRKLEHGQRTKRQHDSLTLSLVRQWPKK